MSPSRRRWIGYLAWSVWGLIVASAAIGIAIRFALPAPIPANRFQFGEAGFFAFGALTLAYATTALIIVSRRPNHPIGWILFFIGAMYGLSAATAAFMFPLLTAVSPEAPPVLWLAWLTVITAFLAGTALFLLIWLFPDGRSPFRAPWLPLLVATTVLSQIIWSFADRNWLFPTLGTPVKLPPPLDAVAGAMGTPMMVVGGAIAALGMIAIVTLRARASRGIERQQLKWFAFAAALAAGMLAILATAGALLPGRAPLGELPLVFFLLSTTSIPIAVAIAILRYRLYDIDRIISRTLVYGMLTAFLAATYGLGVIVMSALFAPVTGGDSLAVAAATLAVAGLFQPIRRRTQVLVDRRFNRAHYDAAQIVAAFAGALRDEVDLDALSEELDAVVRRTMQPASSSVWLRSAPQRAVRP